MQAQQQLSGFSVRQDAFSVLQTIISDQLAVQAIYFQGVNRDKMSCQSLQRIPRLDLLEAESVEDLLGEDYATADYWTATSRIETIDKGVGHIPLIKLRNDRTLTHPEQRSRVQAMMRTMFPQYEGVICEGTNRLHVYINTVLDAPQWRQTMSQLKQKHFAHEQYITDSLERGYGRLRVSETEGRLPVPRVQYIFNSHK